MYWQNTSTLETYQYTGTHVNNTHVFAVVRNTRHLIPDTVEWQIVSPLFCPSVRFTFVDLAAVMPLPVCRGRKVSCRGGGIIGANSLQLQRPRELHARSRGLAQ